MSTCKNLKTLLTSTINWLENFFNIDIDDRPTQLIPVREDHRKPGRNINHYPFEDKLLKILLVLITMLLFLFTGFQLGFDH